MHQSHLPCRKGWQFVCCIGRPRRGADVREDERRGDLGRNLAEVTVVPGGLHAVEDPWGVPAPYQPTPKPSPFVVVGAEPRVQALVDQRVRGLVEQLLEQDGRARVGEPATHGRPPIVAGAGPGFLSHDSISMPPRRRDDSILQWPGTPHAERRRCRMGADGRRTRQAVSILAITALDLSRVQFALTTLYHFTFVPLTLGLGAAARDHADARLPHEGREVGAARALLRDAVPDQLRDRRRRRGSCRSSSSG